MTTQTQVSKKVLATWSESLSVGIYEGDWIIKLYSDRALLTMPTVKWVGNTGGYHEIKSRITGGYHQKLLQIQQKQAEDDAEYTELVKNLLWDMQHDGLV